MRLLGIETSCDETAVALVELSTEGPPRLCHSLISSQTQLHERWGGVVPEIATREHLRNLPLLTRQLLAETSLTPESLDGIAVTSGPGLPTALLVGTSYAKGLAAALGKPIYGINHLEGHLFSPFLDGKVSIEFPFVGLIVSGGHTLLVSVEGWNCYRKLGGTVDDAAGEAFDKVARLLGLPYPGGPQIEKLARAGNPKAYDFPQSFPERDNFNFSFSGLKTSVRYFLDAHPEVKANAPLLAGVSASFQEAVVEVLVKKAIRATRSVKAKSLIAAGGVVCNGELRKKLQAECETFGIQLRLAEATHCTDNAAMIASIAAEKLRAGCLTEFHRDFNPNESLFG